MERSRCVARSARRALALLALHALTGQAAHAQDASQVPPRAAEAVNVPVIASGGVGKLEHLAEGLECGASAVLAAGIFHFGQHTVVEAKQFLRDRGIAVRPPEVATT